MGNDRGFFQDNTEEEKKNINCVSKRWLIIDSSHLIYKASFVLNYLSYDEVKTGVIFGFLNSFISIVSKFGTRHICFCWDSKKSKRKEVFPSYKEKRRKKVLTDREKYERKEMFRQADILYKEVLPYLGIKNNFKIEGLEADDIIANLVKQLDGEKIIVTSDDDMLQLLDNETFIYNTNKKTSFTVNDFEKKYGILSLQWADVKALAGCKSDDVPGISGIGEKTAIQFLKGELKPASKKYGSIVSKEGKDTYEFMYRLVKLPFEKVELSVDEKPIVIDMNNFVDICDRFNFTYFLKKDNYLKWKQNLSA